MFALLLFLLGLLLSLYLAQGLQLSQRLLDRLCDSVNSLHMRSLVCRIIQCPFHDEYILTLPYGRGVLTQHDVINTRQPIFLGQIRAACCQSGTVVVVLAAESPFEAANSIFGLAMKRILYWK